jgi:hypothetical protein
MQKTDTSAPQSAVREAPLIGRDEKAAWERCPYETSRAYAYAWQYFSMGAPGRSLEKMGEKVSITVRQLKRYSTRWQWVRRAAAYDQWIEATHQKAAALLAVQDAEKWAQRMRDLHERKYQQSQQVLDQADTMLKFPLSEIKRTVVVDDSGRETQIQIIKPAKWSKGDVPRLLACGHKMASDAGNKDATQADILKIDDWDVMIPYTGEESNK